MGTTLSVHVNGQSRTFPELSSPAPLPQLLDHLGLKADRIAIEHNGEIVGRATWATTEISNGDKLEIVHFVGGGSPVKAPAVA